jgi:site-specific recombinase XerD
MNITEQTVDSGTKNFMTEGEIKREAARRGRHGARDFCMMLVAYRHGLRVSELIDIRMSEIDLETARINVRRVKGSLSTSQPIEGNELRAIRAWLRERSLINNAAASPFLFLSERGPFTRQAINYLVEQIGKQGKLGFRCHPHTYYTAASSSSDRTPLRSRLSAPIPQIN